MPLQDLRQSYDRTPLRRADLLANPFDQFAAWFGDAEAAGIREPNAMTLATANAQGWPSARVVLLKDIDPSDTPDRGFVFYTNYGSAKADDLANNPRAELSFYWDDLKQTVRTVRVAGAVTRVSAQATADYFRTRPRGSQLGAWCSRQSAVIAGRDVLETRQQELEAQYPGDTPIPTPPFWGGYRVTPVRIEFWQGQTSRLHDRFRYTREGDAWVIERLSP